MLKAGERKDKSLPSSFELYANIAVLIRQFSLCFHTDQNFRAHLIRAIVRRHVLPMFTSLLNTVCAYDPVGYGVPYNHLLFTDSLEPLVDVALQILIVTLDHDTTSGAPLEEGAIGDNLFINYLSRIHRDEGNAEVSVFSRAPFRPWMTSPGLELTSSHVTCFYSLSAQTFSLS